MTAAEALRKARATMEHGYSWRTRDRRLCWMADYVDRGEINPFGLHRYAASALLDGFTVEELTEAGG